MTVGSFLQFKGVRADSVSFMSMATSIREAVKRESVPGAAGHRHGCPLENKKPPHRSAPEPMSMIKKVS